MPICPKYKSRYPHIEKHAYFACFSLSFQPAFFEFIKLIKSCCFCSTPYVSKEYCLRVLDDVFRVEVEKTLYIVRHNDERTALGSCVLIIATFKRTFRLTHCNGKRSDVG